MSRQVADRTSLSQYKVYVLLAAMIFSSLLNTPAVLAQQAQQAAPPGQAPQSECGPDGLKNVPPSTQTSGGQGQTRGEICYDKFLWLNNGLDYWKPCSTGSGGSNGSNSPSPAASGSGPNAANGQWVYPTAPAPTSTISDHHGTRGGAHQGVDIAAPDGTPIYAAHSGTVVAAGPASGFGNWIIIDTDDGQRSTVYGHMWDHGVDVKVGQRVNAGDKIGEVGSAGGSTGPHLHFEVWEGGTRLGGGHHVDPEPYITNAPAADPNQSPNQNAASGSAQQPAQSSCCMTPDTSGSGVGTPEIVGANNEEKLWNYLISQGLTPEQAAGVMGNLAWESGDKTFEKATDSEELSGGGGYGLAQWTGGRRTAIEQAAANEAARLRAEGKNVTARDVLTDFGFQLNYLVQESKGRTQRDDSSKNEWEGLKEQKSIEDANRYWMYNYERPGHLAEEKRLALAKEYYQKYTGKSPSDPAAATQSSSTCADSSDEENKNV